MLGMEEERASMVYLPSGQCLVECCIPRYFPPRIALASLPAGPICRVSFSRLRDMGVFRHTAYRRQSSRHTRWQWHYPASHLGIESVVSNDPEATRRSLLTSVKSILRRKAGAADFRRIVWLLGFFQSEHSSTCQPLITIKVH
jgi:hypothetical protein